MVRRIKPDMRRDEILTAATELAMLHGYTAVHCRDLAKRAGTSWGNIFYHFGSMGSLRSAVLAKAVAEENLTIVAQAMAVRDPDLAYVPETLLNRARAAL